MEIWRAEDDCYYALLSVTGDWVEIARRQGVVATHGVEAEDDLPIHEYMKYVLDGAKRVQWDDVPDWVRKARVET